MHSRQQIREAFVTALSAIPDSTTFNGRVFALSNAMLPAYAVYSREETIKTDNNEGGRILGLQKRTTVFSVEIYAKIGADLDNELDRLAALAETALFNNALLRALLRCFDLASMDTDVSKEGENPLGVMTLNFDCQYITEDGAPEVIMP